MSGNLMYIPVDLVYPNPRNPRKNFDGTAMAELVASVQQVGILQPVVVVPDVAEDYSSTRYRLVAGERRYRAALDAGIKKLPAVVRDLTEREELEIMIVENLQRKDINPIEEAHGFRALLDTGYKQEQLAEKLGCSQSHIANRLRLLELPESVQQNISRGIIGPGHAKELLACKKADPAVIEKVAERAVKEGLTVKNISREVAHEMWNSSRPLTKNEWPEPEFDTAGCEKCKKKTMLKIPWGDNEKLRCMNPDCWEAKQKEALQKAAEEREKKLQSKFPDAVILDDLLKGTNFMQLGDRLLIEEFCRPRECPNFKQGRPSGQAWVNEYCFNPEQYENCKNEYEQHREEKQQEEVEQIKDMVARQLDGGMNRNILLFLAGTVISCIGDDAGVYEYLKGVVGEVPEFEEGDLAGSEWTMLHGVLDKLSNEQILKVAVEWSCLLLGPESQMVDWFLKQELELKNESADVENTISERVGWILRNSVSDSNYKSQIPQLTDEELLYCLENETRKSGLQKLRIEAKKRGIQVPVRDNDQCKSA